MSNLTAELTCQKLAKPVQLQKPPTFLVRLNDLLGVFCEDTMKVKVVKYERLINTGNFTHEKYGIEIELEKDDTAESAVIAAKKFVERQLQQPSIEQRAIAEQVNHFDTDGENLPF